MLDQHLDNIPELLPKKSKLELLRHVALGTMFFPVALASPVHSVILGCDNSFYGMIWSEGWDEFWICAEEGWVVGYEWVNV